MPSLCSGADIIVAHTPALATPLAVGVAQALPRRPRRIQDARHARQVLGTAVTNRCVLPKWGINSPIRDHGAEPGQYTGTVGWTSREHYLAYVVPAAIALHGDVLAKHHVSPDTFRAWVEAKSLYAQERRSGRRVIVRPQTLAGLMQCCLSTVHRCQRAAREIGLEIVITPGRMLSDFEAYKARRNGSPQRGLSTVSAFVVPSSLDRPVEHDTPSSGLSLSSSVTDSPALKSRSARPKRAPLRSARHQRKRPRPGDPAWDLAKRLTERQVFLRGCPAGRLTAQLRRFTTTTLPHRWTTQQLIDAMDAVNRRRGWNAPWTSKTAPWGLLRWYLTQIDEVADHPNHDGPLIPTIPWCGHCDSDEYRWVLDPATGRPLRRCSTCHPSEHGLTSQRAHP